MAQWNSWLVVFFVAAFAVVTLVKLLRSNIQDDRASDEEGGQCGINAFPAEARGQQVPRAWIAVAKDVFRPP